jgi:hypothetical protein
MKKEIRLCILMHKAHIMGKTFLARVFMRSVTLLTYGPKV